jgi:hypothetical protein
MERLSNLFTEAWPYLVALMSAGPVVFIVSVAVARPIQRFFDLRTEIKRSMLLLWDAPIYGMQEDPEEWENQMTPFKANRGRLIELSAEISALSQSEVSGLTVIRSLGYDPGGAGRAARKLALELGTNIEDRDRNYRQLDTALKFRFDAKHPFYNPYNPGS